MTNSATLARLPTAITADITGNVTIAGNVGIGTSSTTGIGSNVFTVYGTARHYGNVVISNLAAGGAGIYFPDGTFQTTAASGTGTGTGNYGNTNVASYLSGPVLVGNIYIGNTTASTSTTSGALIANGGAGIGGNLNVGGNIVSAGNIVTTGTSGNITGVNDLSTVTVTATGNIRLTTVGRGIVFPDNTYQTTAAYTSFGPLGTIQYAGTGNTFAGNSGSLFWDTSNSRLGVGTGVPNTIFNVNGTSVPLFQTSNAQIGGNNYEILVGNSTVHGVTLGYVNNTTVPYGYLSAGSSVKNIVIAANGRVGIGGAAAPQVLLDVGGGGVFGSAWAGNTNFINPPTNGLAVQGSVGIGTYTPLSTLDVNGIVSARTAFSTGGAASVSSLNSNSTIQAAGTATVNSLVSNGAVSGTTGTFTGALYGASFNTGGTATVNSLVSNGAISGTTGAFSGALTLTSAAPQINLSNGTSNWLAWNQAGVGAPTFTTSSVGTKLILYPQVGAAAADYAIGIEGNTQWFGVPTTTQQFKWYGGTTQAMLLSGAGALTTTGTVSATGHIATGSTAAGTGNGMYLVTTNTLGFATNGVESLRIDSVGNLTTTGASATTGYNMDFGGSVRVVGGVVATGEITAYFSDQRLKANITAITNAVDKVMAINGVYYNANQLAHDIAGEDITIQRVGLLAQEVESILPHIVKAAPFDIGDNGTSKSGEHYKTLQYERMVPLLVEAIKEQQKTIDDLQTRMAKLESMMGGSN